MIIMHECIDTNCPNKEKAEKYESLYRWSLQQIALINKLVKENKKFKEEIHNFTQTFNDIDGKPRQGIIDEIQRNKEIVEKIKEYCKPNPKTYDLAGFEVIKELKELLEPKEKTDGN